VTGQNYTFLSRAKVIFIIFSQEEKLKITAEQMERNIKEIWDLFKETDKQFKATDARLEKRFEETEESIREVNLSIK
jgi:hypothetical protein